MSSVLWVVSSFDYDGVGFGTPGATPQTGTFGVQVDDSVHLGWSEESV